MEIKVLVVYMCVRARARVCVCVCARACVYSVCDGAQCIYWCVHVECFKVSHQLQILLFCFLQRKS